MALNAGKNALGRVIATQSSTYKQILFLSGSHKSQCLESIMSKLSTTTTIMDAFLPQNYPLSVSHHYTPWVAWGFVSYACSSACGVFATQSLLAALGFTSSAFPLAAGLNWVLKDGIGQLGSVLFAGRFGSRFDAAPRRWSLNSALFLDAASLLELCTPLFPGLFLPLASIANLGKNLAYMSGSATRAAIHCSMLRADNLADVTSKSVAQAIASSIIGTTIGLLSSVSIPTTMTSRIITFSILAFAHLFSHYNALRHVETNTLCVDKVEILAHRFINDKIVYTTNEFQSVESILLPLRSPLSSVPLRINPTLSSVVHSKLHLQELISRYAGSDYIIVTEDGKVSILFMENACESSILLGMLETSRLRQTYIETGAFSEEESRSFVTEKGALFLDALEKAKWNVSNLFVEGPRFRLSIVEQGDE